MQHSTDYSFSHTAYSYSHSLDEIPAEIPLLPRDVPTSESRETVPLDAFAHASTMQALARFLVDNRGLSFTAAARLLGRSPKSVWSSYHQTTPLPPLSESINIPISIFTAGPAPLESLVLYLRRSGLRNVEIARALRLDPKTTWTAAKRGEARR